MAIRLVISDVDGTLLTRDQLLTDRARAAVARLRAAGVRFAIASARPPRGMAMLVKPLALTTPLAAFNGGMLVAPDLTTVLEQRIIPLAVATEVLDYLLGAGLDAWVFRGADWFIRRGSAPHVAHQRQTLRLDPTVIADPHDALDGAVKIVGVSDDHDLVARCEAELRRSGARASTSRSQPYYLDITHPDANKGTVVRFASRILDIPLDEIAVIGDMPTDVLMFGVAGTSIAMGNASPDVQRAARHITASNENEGFAAAIERFVLGASGTGRSTPVAPTERPRRGGDPIRVLVFAASLRTGSLNARLASLARRVLERHRATVDFAQMRDFDAPSYNYDVEMKDGIPPGARELIRRLQANDAFVIVSPEYNGSLPGHLKNLIDWVSRVRPQPFHTRHALLLSASPSMMGGNRGLWSLRIPLEHLGARVFPDMFSLAQADKALSAEGEIGDEQLHARFDETFAAFLDLVEAAKHYPSMKKAWVEFLGEPACSVDRVDRE